MKMIEILEKVLVQAMKKEPRAWLYEIQLVMVETDNGKVYPGNIYEMQIIFGMPFNRTLIYRIDKNEKITEKEIGEPWLEDCPIPHKILNGLEAAFERMKQANLPYKEVYPEVILRHPLYPGVMEPAYFFSVEINGKKEFVSVGLFSANVQLAK